MKPLSGRPQLIIVMGVSGCGKSTVATQLANQWGYKMLDADDFHTSEAKEKMAKLLPLTDADRGPWIQRMIDFIGFHAKETGIVLAYSGLKKEHRHKFRSLGLTCRYVFIHGDKATIELRMRGRRGHFFPASLLNSQFEALELPLKEESDVLQFSLQLSPNEVCKAMNELFQ